MNLYNYIKRLNNSVTSVCIHNISGIIYIFSEIIQAVDSDSSENDFSGSSSDFVPDKSDEEVCYEWFQVNDIYHNLQRWVLFI